ncbi:UNVERIFIED_CONTAM: (+)-neomenthol dehydrogenase [Sesamum radiatum]|uniref:(+)-neomenthol dehydrogenase n=1 Tax=Sesamum radiatum TaxID=300843 RepID=A0AAW2URC1_SESRA
MEPNAVQPPTTRYAVVTGGNKGIGLETVRQLAKAGVTVVLTARDEKRGMEATRLLHESGLTSNVVFHQLDVRDAKSIQSLVDFITTQFGRLDILLAGKAVNLIQDVVKITYDSTKECLDTNYYGVKNLTEALLPLLQRSTSGARIVNVSVPRVRNVTFGMCTCKRELLMLLKRYLDWQIMLPPYSISKATLNVY